MSFFNGQLLNVWMPIKHKPNHCSSINTLSIFYGDGERQGQGGISKGRNWRYAHNSVVVEIGRDGFNGEES
jgi:hypothetical protein